MDDKNLTSIAEGVLTIFPMFIKNFGKIDSISTNANDHCCLPPSHRNILNLLDTFGVLNMTDISDRLCINKCNLTPIVNNLIDKDLVIKSVDSRDRRINKLSLTKKGENLVDYFKSAAINNLKESLCDFTDDELNALLHHLTSIQSNIYNVKCREKK